MSPRHIPAIPPPFDQAVRDHEAALMRLAMRLTRDREDALDLFQETWLRAYRAYAQLDSAAGLKSWLFRIAVNLSRNRRRDRVRHDRVIVGSSAGLEENAPGVDSGQDGVMFIRGAIDALPRKQKRSLTMRKLEGRSYAEIAVALDCSEQSARANVHQALKKLKESR